jgi:subtilase family serine protease
MRRSRLLAVAVSTATVAALGAAVGGTSVARTSAASAVSRANASVVVHPQVILLKSAPSATAQTTAQCRAQLQISCYNGRQIEQAYGTPQLYSQGITGAGETIVIVDAFGSPSIQSDLAAFDAGMGLPAPPSLTVIQPAGPVPPYHPNGLRINWVVETSLDVEYSHAIAPGANIVLVETPVAETEGEHGFPQILEAENFVIKHHLGIVMSQSFGATEESFPSPQTILAQRATYRAAAAAGITVTASTGDFGAANVKRNGSDFYRSPVVGWPATDPLVTAVGGTQLHLNAAGNAGRPANAWNDTYNKSLLAAFTGSTTPSPFSTGGGDSHVFARPSWQNGVKGVVGEHRGIPDISMSGACDGAVDVFLGAPGLTPGFYLVCGTSEASPEFAGIVALTAQAAGHPLGVINPALYKMSAAGDAGIVDVTKGDNTVSFMQDGAMHTVHGFDAGTGYDKATGIGTLWAPDFVPELAAAAG